MSYSKPPIDRLPFKFTDTGYQRPNFNNLDFRFGLRPSTSQTANLQAAINIMGLYQTSTYTYLKSCDIIVVGYGSGGVQVLQLPCLYGGLRDLGASLIRVSPNVDLPAYIFALSNFKNLIGYITGLISDYRDLPGCVFGYLPIDLPGSVHGFDTRDLFAYLGGWQTGDLSAYIYGIPPRDLSAILNVIEIRNLPASITGEWWHGDVDLGGIVQDIFLRDYKNLQAIIRAWAEKDLGGTLHVMHPFNLSATLNAGYFEVIRNLQAYVFGIAAGILYANIHGFDTRNLSGSLLGAFGPGDLRASLNTIDPKNMSAYIRGFGGLEIPDDLRGHLEGVNVYDLQALIDIIEGADLPAYINILGKSVNLGAIIIPKTILIRKTIFVSLLNHHDLKAMINFMCTLSQSENLSAYVYALMKKDLKAYIIGWYGSTTDNLKDLRAYINTTDYSAQDALSPITFFPIDDTHKYALLGVSFGSIDKYITFDTLPINFGSLYSKDLIAYVTGIPTSSDLSARLTAVFDINYTELPPWIIPKSHEVVINMEKLEEQWRKFVEIMFDNASDVDFHYFYVNGEQKVYRLNRSTHWTIWVKSYTPDDTSIIDRRNVRFKYGFNMSSYNTVDEAVRDLIDRVSAYRRVNLSASINAIPKYSANLYATLQTKFLYHWNNNLNSFIYGYVQDQRSLPGVVIGEFLHGQGDITASLTPADYTPPEGDSLIFNFEDDTYLPPVYDDVDVVWTGEDAE